MKEFTVLISFYGGCIEDVSLFDDEEKLAAAFEKATGASYDSYLNETYEPDLEHEYVECHNACIELGVMEKEEVGTHIASIAQKSIPELAERMDLESRGNDSDDFFTTSVWSLKAALLDAYKLGREQALTHSLDKPSLDSMIQSASKRTHVPQDPYLVNTKEIEPKL